MICSFSIPITEPDGPVMPVHARDTAVQGVLAYRSVSDLPLTADLAVIASPPAEVRKLKVRLARAK